MPFIHVRDALSIRLRFRWRGAACYTAHDLRALTNAAHLLALLGPEIVAMQSVAISFIRCTSHARRSHPPKGWCDLVL